MAGGPLWAARSSRRPSRGGNRVLGDFHPGVTVHRRVVVAAVARDGSAIMTTALSARGASPGRASWAL